MTDQEIKELAENALHQACSFMQDALGVKTGDVAGMFFTGGFAGSDIHCIFEKYIKTEFQFNNCQPTERHP